MNNIQMNVTIPASSFDDKRIETIPVTLPDAEANNPTVRKVTVVRTSSWMLTEDELAACCIELTRQQMACLMDILYKVTESPIIFYLVNGQPVLEIYDDYRE